MAAAAVEATDEQLVAAARDGNDAAFEALFRRYRDRITAYVRGIVSDYGRAEDIVQDAFISAHRNLLASEREIAFKPWLYEIAKNACIDHLRRAKRAHEVSLDSDDFSPRDEGRLSAGVAPTDAEVSRRHELDSLKMAFHELPEQQHDILVMRELEGLSYERIGSRMGISRSAVESMLFRARRRLKDEFDDIETGERCFQTQAVMAKLASGRIGIRAERRLQGHLRDCAGCRREAVAMGLDELALGSLASKARSAISRAASFLPIPGFLRRRFGDGANLLGQAGASGAEQSASFAAKAIAIVAAAALVGGGAGVAQRAAGTGTSGGAPAAKQGGSQTPVAGVGGPAAGSGAGSAAGGGSGLGSGAAAGTPGAPGAGGGGRGGSSAGGGSSPSTLPSVGGGVDGAKNSLGETIQGQGGAAQGAAGQVGSGAGGVVGGTTQDLGSAVQGVTKGTGQSVQQVGTNLGNSAGTAVGGSSGAAVGGTVKKVGDTAGQTVTGLGNTTGTALKKVGSTVNSVTSPQTQTTPPPTTVPKLNVGL
jgi:RNA polymerase sigma factor (sigma-70 family)